eukprot:3693419-Rhodomonas_salina.2
MAARASKECARTYQGGAEGEDREDSRREIKENRQGCGRRFGLHCTLRSLALFLETLFPFGIFGVRILPSSQTEAVFRCRSSGLRRAC